MAFVSKTLTAESVFMNMENKNNLSKTYIHQLNGHEFEQAPRDGEGQGSLVSCSPWGGKELDMIERLNNNKAYIHGVIICINKPQSVVIK